MIWVQIGGYKKRVCVVLTIYVTNVYKTSDNRIRHQYVTVCRKPGQPNDVYASVEQVSNLQYIVFLRPTIRRSDQHGRKILKLIFAESLLVCVPRILRSWMCEKGKTHFKMTYLMGLQQSVEQ
jgi:hypothetical protein